MGSIESIKRKLKNLYETDPSIHISVKLTRPRITVEGTPVKIVGVYRHIFQIEEDHNGRPTRHTFRYEEVMIGHVVIQELE